LHSLRKLLGEGLGSCSIDELQKIEQQLERSISKIRAKKVSMINQQAYIILNFTDDIKSELSIIQTQVFREQIEQLKEKVSFFEQKMFVIN